MSQAGVEMGGPQPGPRAPAQGMKEHKLRVRVLAVAVPVAGEAAGASYLDPVGGAVDGAPEVRPSTLMALAEDYVASLAAQGFTRFYFLNGHGGNIAPLKAMFQALYTATSLGPAGNATAPRCRLRSWWELPQTNGLRQALYGEWEGLHATPSEVAITQHALPATARAAAMAKPAPLSAEFLRDHAGDNHDDAHTHRRRFPDGRVGSDPSLATPADGKRLLACAVAELGADYQAFLAED